MLLRFRSRRAATARARFRASALAWLPVLAAAGVLACGDEADEPAADASVVRLDGELPDVGRPPLDALTTFETGSSDADHDDGIAPSSDGDSSDAGPSVDSGAADAGGRSCTELAATHAAALADAQRCERGSDCAELACDNPCCTCRVYVVAGAAPGLERMLADLTAAGCLGGITCPDFPCPEPTGASCHRGACMTTRE